MAYKIINGKMVKDYGPAKIMAFGAYYHDDQDDGWSLCFSQGNEPVKGFTKMLADTTNKCVAAEYNEYLTHNYAYFDNAQDRAQAIQNIWSNLKAAIREYNYEAFGTAVRPLKSQYQVNLNNEYLLSLITGCLTNIALLCKLGEIKDDNYNGMYYAYSQQRVVA